MRIVCPICSAAYEVLDNLLVPGRAVRCARCSEEWVAVPLSPPAPPEAEGEQPASPPEEQPIAPPQRQPQAASPRLTAMDRLASQAVAPPPVSVGLRAAWAASVVVLLLFGWGVIAWRADLMHVWPPSTRLYAAVGLAPAQSPSPVTPPRR